MESTLSFSSCQLTLHKEVTQNDNSFEFLNAVTQIGFKILKFKPPVVEKENPTLSQIERLQSLANDAVKSSMTGKLEAESKFTSCQLTLHEEVTHIEDSFAFLQAVTELGFKILKFKPLIVEKVNSTLSEIESLQSLANGTVQSSTTGRPKDNPKKTSPAPVSEDDAVTSNGRIPNGEEKIRGSSVDGTVQVLGDKHHQDKKKSVDTKESVVSLSDKLEKLKSTVGSDKVENGRQRMPASTMKAKDTQDTLASNSSPKHEMQETLAISGSSFNIDNGSGARPKTLSGTKEANKAIPLGFEVNKEIWGVNESKAVSPHNKSLDVPSQLLGPPAEHGAEDTTKASSTLKRGKDDRDVTKLQPYQAEQGNAATLGFSSGASKFSWETPMDSKQSVSAALNGDIYGKTNKEKPLFPGKQPGGLDYTAGALTTSVERKQDLKQEASSAQAKNKENGNGMQALQEGQEHLSKGPFSVGSVNFVSESRKEARQAVTSNPKKGQDDGNKDDMQSFQAQKKTVADVSVEAAKILSEKMQKPKQVAASTSEEGTCDGSERKSISIKAEQKFPSPVSYKDGRKGSENGKSSSKIQLVKPSSQLGDAAISENDERDEVSTSREESTDGIKRENGSAPPSDHQQQQDSAKLPSQPGKTNKAIPLGFKEDKVVLNINENKAISAHGKQKEPLEALSQVLGASTEHGADDTRKKGTLAVKKGKDYSDQRNLQPFKAEKDNTTTVVQQESSLDSVSSKNHRSQSSEHASHSKCEGEARTDSTSLQHQQLLQIPYSSQPFDSYYYIGKTGLAVASGYALEFEADLIICAGNVFVDLISSSLRKVYKGLVPCTKIPGLQNVYSFWSVFGPSSSKLPLVCSMALNSDDASDFKHLFANISVALGDIAAKCRDSELKTIVITSSALYTGLKVEAGEGKSGKPTLKTRKAVSRQIAAFTQKLCEFLQQESTSRDIGLEHVTLVCSEDSLPEVIKPLDALAATGKGIYKHQASKLEQPEVPQARPEDRVTTDREQIEQSAVSEDRLENLGATEKIQTKQSTAHQARPVALVETEKEQPESFRQSTAPQARTGGVGAIEKRRPERSLVPHTRTRDPNAIETRVFGNQPKGKMDCYSLSESLPGHENCGTYVIMYSFKDGIQNRSHPHPGVPYQGTERVAYLPKSELGTEVLYLLRLSFLRGLTFSVGRSMTTGKDNVVVWAGIEHKSKQTGGKLRFGYPDEDYLYAVTSQLKQVGVTFESITEDERASLQQYFAQFQSQNVIFDADSHYR